MFGPHSGVAALVGFVGLALLAGAVGGALTARSVHGWYLTLHFPPGTPPNWVFGPVWGTLYVLMGVAAWRAWRCVGVDAARRLAALRLWGWQLLVNALWSAAFFGLRSPLGGLIVIALLLALLVRTLVAFARVEPVAALLLLPYLAWTGYAGYLAAGFWWLNS